MKIGRFLKTRDTALSPQTCTFGYPGMGVHGEYKTVCEVYLKKVHQVWLNNRNTKQYFRLSAKHHVWLMFKKKTCELNLI